LFHTLFDFSDFHVELLQLRGEVWVYNVIVLAGFTYVNALFKHLFELAEF
jgi:hypothetical protein